MSTNKPPGRAQGFTLVELLVAMLIGTVLLTATAALVNGHRKLYDADSRRIEVSQNLRSALLVLSNDARQAGERLSAQFPAVELFKGPVSDTVILRRSLLDVALPLCKDIKGGSSQDVVFVAKNGGSSKVPEACKDADPGRLASWVAFRNAAPDGKISVFVYDPVTRQGETFTYDAENRNGQSIHRESGKWMSDYDIENGPVLYVIEERQYRVENGKLMLTENGMDQAVAPGIVSLRAVAELQSGAAVTTNFPSSTLDWKDLRHIQLSLTGTSGTGPSATTRTLSEKVTPRNVFSADQ